LSNDGEEAKIEKRMVGKRIIVEVDVEVEVEVEVEV
jgi:hypothetical protein